MANGRGGEIDAQSQGGSGIAAYIGLQRTGEMAAGNTVVISAAAGAVGSVAGQVARLKGCRAVGIAGGADKCALARDLGYHATVDYKAPGAFIRLMAGQTTGKTIVRLNDKVTTPG